MKHFVRTFLLVGASVLSANAQPYSLAVELHTVVVAKESEKAEWRVSLSNSSTTAIRFSHFSLASAIRATEFFDDTGNKWQVIRPKLLIDPPCPAIDFSLRVPAKSIVSFTIQTEGLECLPLPKDREMQKLNLYPEILMYKLERNIDVLDDTAQRGSRWIGCGTGLVSCEWEFINCGANIVGIGGVGIVGIGVVFGHRTFNLL